MRKASPPVRLARHAGVTLIELAITIALVGILSALIVQFVAPVRSYIDSSRRAGLADTADTALRRIGRDLRLALPNSVRVDGTGKFVEFLLVRTGGRYRFDTDPAVTNTCNDGASSVPANDVLSFAVADTCFKTLGNLYAVPSDISNVTTNDYVVVFNLQPGTASADAYQFPGTGGNKSKIAAAVAGTGQDRIAFAGNTFTYESPGNRFFIIEGPVTYGCDLGTGKLTRYWGYTITATQTPVPPSGGSSALLASGVTDCSFTYQSSVTAQGAGLVTMALQLRMQDSRGDPENVNLYHAVHVNNVP
jgi:MSHA biogenesis protein MshO